jgi:GAF domain-containing protein
MERSELIATKLSILQEISNAIVVTDNTSAIANLMLDLAVNYTTAEKGSLMLVNERNELFIFAAKGIDTQLIRTYRSKIGEGIAGTVAAQRSPVLVESIKHDKRFKRSGEEQRYKTNSFISCPVLSKNRLLGVLNINDKRDGTPFTENEFALIKIIANQAAISLENALLMSQLRAKAAELEAVNSTLIETDAAKTEFLTRISHELRTPLNSIKGAVYYLQKSGTAKTGEQKEFHDIIANETGKLIGTVEELLDYLRTEDELRVIRTSIIPVAALIEEIVASRTLRTVLAQKELALNIDIQKGISDFPGDKIRAIQFFTTLLEALRRYLRRGDVLHLAARENGCIEIAITLPHRMSEASPLLRHLFQPLSPFQKEQAREHLRLELARKIAEAHQWTLSAKNSDTACTVSLCIPKGTRQKADTAIATIADLFADVAAEMMGLHRCSLMLVDDLTGDLCIRGSRGIDDETVKKTRIKLGERIAGWVAMEGTPLLIEDIERDHYFGRRNAPHYNTGSLISLPLKIGDRVLGVLNLNNKKTATPLAKEELYIGSVLSSRIAHCLFDLARDGYREDGFRNLILSFDNLVGAQKRNRTHTTLLSGLLLSTMEHLHATEEEKALALYISRIYDLGLVLVDESVLSKETLLPSDARTLKVHPYTTVDLISFFEYSEEVKRAILHHHERYDGKGYPDGLRGKEIPFIARCIAVVDAFCALSAERPYRKALHREAAREEIRSGAGSRYDPAVVEAFEAAAARVFRRAPAPAVEMEPD